MCECVIIIVHLICLGHATTPCLLVGTNQGGIMAYTIDMPTEKHRDSKSPIVMPIGKVMYVPMYLCIVQLGRAPQYTAVVCWVVGSCQHWVW